MCMLHFLNIGDVGDCLKEGVGLMKLTYLILKSLIHVVVFILSISLTTLDLYIVKDKLCGLVLMTMSLLTVSKCKELKMVNKHNKQVLPINHTLIRVLSHKN